MAKIIISLSLFNNFKLDDDTKVLTIDTGLYAPSGLRFEERFFGEHYLVYETKHSKHRNSEPTDDPSVVPVEPAFRADPLAKDPTVAVAPLCANATEPPKEKKHDDTNCFECEYFMTDTSFCKNADQYIAAPSIGPCIEFKQRTKNAIYSNLCGNCLNFDRPALQCKVRPLPIKFGGVCGGFQAIKQDAEKARMELLPFDALLGVGKVLGYGAKKYKENSWQHVNKNRYIGALLRHLEAYQRGEITDAESGLPHLDHLACNALFISALEKRAPCINDRVVSPGDVNRYGSSL